MKAVLTGSVISITGQLGISSAMSAGYSVLSIGVAESARGEKIILRSLSRILYPWTTSGTAGFSDGAGETTVDACTSFALHMKASRKPIHAADSLVAYAHDNGRPRA